ncbi:hypothetical protein [Microbacterium karelineae]|uniref:hypothetical protein n=1 Tax=Microbacterium karelineae TaxID=2654283 RepID=UPI0012EABFA9|nr:hypothetical protein [Microbacterium karelineae]
MRSHGSRTARSRGSTPISSTRPSPSPTPWKKARPSTTVEGWLVDLDISVEPAPADLSVFADGSVTLARVEKVTERRAHLSLHPSTDEVVLRRRDIVGEGDETPVFEVLAVGDIVEARVRRDESGAVGLSLLDIDADAPRAAALPLVAGGPSWLRAPHREARGEHPAEPPTTPVEIAAPPTAPAGDVSARLSDLTREVAGMSATLTRLARTGFATPAPAAPRAGADSSDLKRRLGEAQADNRRLLDQLSEANGARRKAEKQTANGSGRPPSRSTRRAHWASDDEWLRHEILLAWVDRVDASDKARFPLADHRIGSAFASSLAPLDEAQFAKAMRAVVDVLTGRAAEIAGRDVHRLRSGWGGDDPPVVRDDGARCWRAAIELNTASARRLHYWELPGGSIELSRVVLHDDTTP